TGSIITDDWQPAIWISVVIDTEGSSGAKSFALMVSLSNASLQSNPVSYVTANGTASAPGDYAATIGTLTFNPGEMTKSINVNVVGDTADEPDETFFVNLTVPSNATLGDGQGQGTIKNDDGAISIGNVSQAEGNSGL